MANYAVLIFFKFLRFMLPAYSGTKLLNWNTWFYPKTLIISPDWSLSNIISLSEK